jgi:hypothetical protein
MKEIRNKKEKKKSEPTELNRPSRPVIRAARCGEYYAPPIWRSAHASQPEFPRFSFSFPIFLEPISTQTRISQIYNIFFGSVCFYVFPT